MARSNLELVRGGWAAASRGEVETLAALLAPDVVWHGAGDDVGGCRNRDQAMRWIAEALSRGVRAELVDARELADGRVLVLLQRNSLNDGESEPPPRHAQIVTVRDGQITEMAVYASADEAVGAAGPA